MICRNCGFDAKNDKFCPNCGAPIQSSACPSCGAQLPPDASRCYSCGWSKFPAQYGGAQQGYAQQGYNQPGYYGQGAPEVNTKSNGLLSRKKKNGSVPPSDKRTLFQTLLCLVGGLAVLAAIGVNTYLMLMGNMFAYESGGTVYNVNPLTLMMMPEGETFSLAMNIELLSEFFRSVPEMFSGGINLTVISQLLIVAFMCIAAVITTFAAIFAVIRFIVGMVSKKNFNLGAFAGAAFGASAMLYLVASAGTLDIIVIPGSGTVTCVILSVVALAVCLAQNLLFAGKRFIKAGSILKWATNAGIFVGAAMCLLFFPFTISNVYDPDAAGIKSEAIYSALAYFESIIGAGAMPSANVMMISIIIVFAFTLQNIITLPFFVGSTASRLAQTFKFDGYEDKSILKKTVSVFIACIVFVVAVFVYINSAGADGVSVAPGVYVYAIGAIIMLVSAILNKKFLNKDQL